MKVMIIVWGFAAFLTVLIAGATTSLNIAVTDESNSTSSGQTLIDIASEVEPVLKLIGTLISNLEKDFRSQKNENLFELISHLHNCAEWGVWLTDSSSNSTYRIKHCEDNKVICQHQVGSQSLNEVCHSTGQCTDWSSWSRCDAINDGDTGNRTRNRRCEFNTQLCEPQLSPIDEIETKVCVKTCPEGYNKTTNGYCVKMYCNEGGRSRSRERAETACETDGGHLVNVNSELKRLDLNDYIVNTYRYGNTGYYWIDGIRSGPGGPWKYKYESEHNNFYIWGDNQPTNGQNDLCMLYHWMACNETTAWCMDDISCDTSACFLCEID